MVRFKENTNAGSLFQPALQFLNVELRFFMLAEGRSIRISFHFRLESLWNDESARSLKPSRFSALSMAEYSYLRGLYVT
jgi:hypothetical protein